MMSNFNYSFGSENNLTSASRDSNTSTSDTSDHPPQSAADTRVGRSSVLIAFRRKGSDKENDGSSSDSGVDEKEKCPSSITPLFGNWRRGEGRSPAKAAFMKFS